MKTALSLLILLTTASSIGAAGGGGAGRVSAGGGTSRSLDGGRVSKSKTSTAIDGGNDHAPIYGGGTSQTLISSPSSFSSSSSSEDYRSIRPHGFWNEEGEDDGLQTIAGGSERTVTAIVTTTTTRLRGADLGGVVSDGRALKSDDGGSGKTKSLPSSLASSKSSKVATLPSPGSVTTASSVSGSADDISSSSSFSTSSKDDKSPSHRGADAALSKAAIDKSPPSSLKSRSDNVATLSSSTLTTKSAKSSSSSSSVSADDTRTHDKSAKSTSLGIKSAKGAKSSKVATLPFSSGSEEEGRSGSSRSSKGSNHGASGRVLLHETPRGKGSSNGTNNTVADRVSASASGDQKRPGGGTGLSLDVEACDCLELCDEDFVEAFEAAAAKNATSEVDKGNASAEKGASATSQTSSRSSSKASLRGDKSKTETAHPLDADGLGIISMSKEGKGPHPKSTKSSGGVKEYGGGPELVGVRGGDDYDEPSSSKGGKDNAGPKPSSSTSSTTTTSRTSGISIKSSKAGKSSKTGKSGRVLMHAEVGKVAKKSKTSRDCASFCGCTIDPDDDPVNDQLLDILV